MYFRTWRVRENGLVIYGMNGLMRFSHLKPRRKTTLMKGKITASLMKKTRHLERKLDFLVLPATPLVLHWMELTHNESWPRKCRFFPDNLCIKLCCLFLYIYFLISTNKCSVLLTE